MIQTSLHVGFVQKIMIPRRVVIIVVIVIVIVIVVIDEKICEKKDENELVKHKYLLRIDFLFFF